MFTQCEAIHPWWYIEDNNLRHKAIEKYPLLKKIENKLVNKENQNNEIMTVKKPKI